MADEGFGVTDPDALLVRAAQSHEAKRLLSLFLGYPWEHIDAHLPAILLEAVQRLPERGGLRREKDRVIARSIARLIAEVPHTDPRRSEIRRTLTSRLHRS